jgi:hypothetical protein
MTVPGSSAAAKADVSTLIFRFINAAGVVAQVRPEPPHHATRGR